MAVAAGIGVYEVGVIAVGAIIAYESQPAVQESNRRTAEALSRGLQNLSSRAQEMVRAKPQSKTIAKAECQEKKNQQCPVCKKAPDPRPGVVPPYLAPPRPPKAAETFPPITAYKKTSKIVQGAAVYERPDGSFVHVDNFHGGAGAELEVYDRRGSHTGTICPNCGAPTGPAVPGRRLPK